MLSIHPGVSKTHPGMQMGILAIRQAAPSVPLAPAEAARAIAAIRQRYGHLDRSGLKALHPVAAYIDYYKRFGYSYHLLGQLESVLRGKRSLQNPSGVLLSMFLTEMESMVLTAGHDLSALAMPLSLEVAAGSETYTSISGKETTAVTGDLMVCDATGVLSSILRGPDAKSRITPQTTDVLFTLYAPNSIESSYIELTLQKLEERIASFSGVYETLLRQVYLAE